MGAYDFMAGLDSQEAAGKNGPQLPFWALDFTNEEKVLEWLNAEITYLKEQAQERHLNQKKNLALYRGIQLNAADRPTRDEAAAENTTKRKSKAPRVIYNHMVDMVEQDVARMTKYRGAVTCSPGPGSDDNEDRIGAEIGEDLIEGFWARSDVDFDYVMQRHVRRRRIMGEDFIGVYWDRNIGPYDLDWVRSLFKECGVHADPANMPQWQLFKELERLKKNGKFPKIPLVDPDSGEHLKSDTGELLYIDRPQRMGDVKYRLHFSWDVFGQRKGDWEECDYAFWREYVNVTTIKAQHPSKADKVEGDKDQTVWDADQCDDITRSNDIEVWHFYHRSTAELDSGRYIKFVRSAILINKDNPYLGDDYRAILPLVRTGDIDTPAVMNGDSTVTHGRGPQAVYNNLISLDVRNKFIFAHPKWMMPKGATKVENLANNTTVVQWTGPAAPEVRQPAIHSDQAMKTEAKTDLQQIMGVFGVSRGDPPAGVTANVALQFLDEQESERANVGVAAITRTQLSVAKRTLWLMADLYGDDEGRLEKILGRNRAALAKDFKMVNLRGLGDVKISNASALPQQKSARTQYILDVAKQWPGIVPQDRAVDLLGLGEVDRLRSIVTVAIRKAENENQALMMGGVPKAPLKHDFHLQHYRVVIQQMNEDAYTKLSEEAQQNFIDHARAHEMFMVEIGAKDPNYAALVMQEFPGFPYFFKPEDMGMAPMAPPLPPAAAGLGVEPPPAPLPPEVMPPGAETAMPPPEGVIPGSEAISTPVSA